MDSIKVLVVDDESRMRKLVKDFLSKKGYIVLEAGDGEEAVDIFMNNKDSKSNRKDSFSLFRYWRFALQKHGSDQKVPVVSVLYSFGLPAFFALKQLNHQSA